MRRQDPRIRFTEKIGQPDSDGHWPWLAKINPRTGAPEFNVEHRKTVRASLFAWTLFTGQDIPAGYTVSRQCDLRACINPEHYALVTVAEARSSARRVARTLASHCKLGHEFSEENTRWAANGSRRYCVTCVRANGVRKRDLKRAAKLAAQS